METWGTLMGRPLQSSGKIVVFGRGDNPINFVSATDVAALVSQAATSPSLRGQILELGGPGDLTSNQVAAILPETIGRQAPSGTSPAPPFTRWPWPPPR
jgi:NADH dehydrogenase